MTRSKVGQGSPCEALAEIYGESASSHCECVQGDAGLIDSKQSSAYREFVLGTFNRQYLGSRRRLTIFQRIEQFLVDGCITGDDTRVDGVRPNGWIYTIPNKPPFGIRRIVDNDSRNCLRTVIILINSSRAHSLRWNVFRFLLDYFIVDQVFLVEFEGPRGFIVYFDSGDVVFEESGGSYLNRNKDRGRSVS
jgi:hypothetical protein